jgi:hypothetical protein
LTGPFTRTALISLADGNCLAFPRDMAGKSNRILIDRQPRS